ncbi:MAG: hypothetical protein WC308_04540, partial [archaeon]
MPVEENPQIRLLKFKIAFNTISKMPFKSAVTGEKNTLHSILRFKQTAIQFLKNTIRRQLLNPENVADSFSLIVLLIFIGGFGILIPDYLAPISVFYFAIIIILLLLLMSKLFYNAISKKKFWPPKTFVIIVLLFVLSEILSFGAIYNIS